jgi:uncharacterized protein YciI
MLFMIHCVDKPDSAAVRQENRDAHLAYLNDHHDRIHAAGPLLADDQGGGPAGSLLLMEFPDQAAAEAFAAADPYNKAGLFQHVEIKPWKQVLP